MPGALRPRALPRGSSLLALGCALAIAGCGSSRTATPAATRLEREDFAAVSRALAGVAPAAGGEVAAARAAWPLIANGLGRATGNGPPGAIRTAAARAARLHLPALFGEARIASLTGPAAHVAGLVRSYRGLAAHGWQMIVASIEAIEHGSPAAARFAKANVALYIESVYDAHFSLAQVGKQLIAGYAKLGGPAAFGASLSQAEVDRLARTYSEANDRLHPHVGVRLGS
jgi:hypothetical protein